MSLYANGIRLLDESDKQPQWNLFTNSSSFKNWTNKTGQIDLKYTSEPLGHGVQTAVAWGQIFQPMYLVENKTYTFSANIFLKDNSQYNCYVNNIENLSISSNVTPNGQGGSVTTGGWKRVSQTFKCLKAGTYAISVTSSDEYAVASYKLEYGTIATPWMPAITDLALKSDLGGVKLNYRLYYATSEKEVA